MAVFGVVWGFLYVGFVVVSYINICALIRLFCGGEKIHLLWSGFWAERNSYRVFSSVVHMKQQRVPSESLLKFFFKRFWWENCDGSFCWVSTGLCFADWLEKKFCSVMCHLLNLNSESLFSMTRIANVIHQEVQSYDLFDIASPGIWKRFLLFLGKLVINLPGKRKSKSRFILFVLILQPVGFLPE